MTTSIHKAIEYAKITAIFYGNEQFVVGNSIGEVSIRTNRGAPRVLFPGEVLLGKATPHMSSETKEQIYYDYINNPLCDFIITLRENKLYSAEELFDLLEDFIGDLGDITVLMLASAITSYKLLEVMHDFGEPRYYLSTGNRSLLMYYKALNEKEERLLAM